MAAHDIDRAVRVRGDSPGDRADQKTLQSAVAVRADHDQTGAPLRVVGAEMARERERDRQRDDEPTLMQADADAADPAEPNLCPHVLSFLLSAGAVFGGPRLPAGQISG